MKPKPEVKLALAITTSLVALFPIYTAVMLFRARSNPAFDPNYSGPMIIGAGNLFNLFVTLIIMGLVIQLFVALYYLVFAVENKEAVDWLRKTLAMGFFLLPVLAMPLYYLIYILPQHPPEWALKPAGEPTNVIQ